MGGETGSVVLVDDGQIGSFLSLIHIYIAENQDMCKVYKLVNFTKRMTLKKAENPWQNPARDFACLSGSLFLDESQQDEVQDRCV